jgi:hypothetical protein
MISHHRSGIKTVRLAMSMLATSVVLFSCKPILAITYNAGPISFSGGHTLTGTIETDGTLGSLTSSNITGWNIEVTGPYPFTFSPSATLSMSGVSATATKLTTTAYFSFDEYVTGAPCDAGNSCNAWLVWEDFTPEVEYRIRDLTLVTTPAHEIELFVGSPTLIATAVPEPGSLSMLLICSLLWPWRYRRSARCESA